jgi:Tfp pilus assembly protein PilN
MDFNKFGTYSMSDTGDRVSIDFAGNLLKIAYIKTSAIKKGKINLIIKNTENLSEDEIAEIIKKSLTDAKIKKPTIVGIIPSTLAIIKNIEIPSTNPQEIKEIVDLQAARHTPYSSEEIIIGYVNVGISKLNYTRIFLIIVNQDVIRRQFEILNKAHLEIKRVIFEPEGINNIVCKILKLESQELPITIIHVDKFSSDFIVSLKGKIIFARSISLGFQNFSQDKEKYITDFKEEVKKSIETYQSEEIGGAISMLVLSGVNLLCQEENLAVSLKNFLDVPVRIFAYDNLPIAQTAYEVISESKDSSFVDVIAPLMTLEQLQIDLIPEEIKIQRIFKEKSKNIIKTGFLVATILVLIGGMLMSKIYFRELYLEKLKVQYKTTNQKAENLEKTFKKVQLVRSYLSRRGYVLEVLSQLYNLITPEIYLNEIKFDQKGSFSIKGTSTSMSSVFSFITTMEQSEYYKDVKTNSTRKREEEGANLVDFEIISVLE